MSHMERTGAEDVVAAGRCDLLIEVRLALADRRAAIWDLPRGALAAAHRLLDFLQGATLALSGFHIRTRLTLDRTKTRLDWPSRWTYSALHTGGTDPAACVMANRSRSQWARSVDP